VPREEAPSASWLLTRALVLRAKLAEVLERAAAVPPEALERAAAEAITPEMILAQAEVLRRRFSDARARAEDAAAAERRAEILEVATALSREIDEVRERYERAVSESVRRELLARIEELRHECALALARVRLVPDVITA
jgi:hypothetical protein